MDAYAAGVAGALLMDDYLAAIRAAGFQNVDVVGESPYELDEPDRAQIPNQRNEGSSITPCKAA